MISEWIAIHQRIWVIWVIYNDLPPILVVAHLDFFWLKNGDMI